MSYVAHEGNKYTVRLIDRLLVSNEIAECGRKILKVTVVSRYVGSFLATSIESILAFIVI